MEKGRANWSPHSCRSVRFDKVANKLIVFRRKQHFGWLPHRISPRGKNFRAENKTRPSKRGHVIVRKLRCSWICVLNIITVNCDKNPRKYKYKMSHHEDSDMLCSLKKFEELLDTGTRSFLSQWSMVPKVCNFILQSDIKLKLILNTIQKKIRGSLHLVSFMSLILQELEKRMQNCGTLTPHNEITVKRCMKKLKKLIRTEYYASITSTSKNINQNKQDRATTSKCISSQNPTVIETSTSFNNDELKDAAITQAPIYVICKDNMPTEPVENEALCPMYKVPSRSILTSRIEEKYSICKSYLTRLFNQANYISLTMTILRNSTKCFLIIYAHFINLETSMLESYYLGTIHTYMTEQVKRSDIVQAFAKTCREFSISSSKFVCITIAHSIHQKAKNLFSPELNWCLIFLINIVVKDSLEISEISKPISEIRHIVTYFENDTTASYALRIEQLKNGTNEDDILYLTQDMPFQWSSTLEMMKKFVKLASILKTVLTKEYKKDEPQMMEQSEMKVIYEFIDLLAPFKEAIIDTSGDKYITASIVLPLCHNVRETLNKLHPTTRLAKVLKKNLLQGIEEIYVAFEKNTLFVIATLLDPRFKKACSFSSISQADAISQLCREINHVANQQKSPLSSKQRLSNTSSQDSKFIWMGHTEIIKTDEMFTPKMPNELELYLNFEVLPLSEDPVSYWLNFKTLYPALAQVALKYCTIMGSSITSKGISTFNNVVSNEKNINSHINKAIFLAQFKNMFSQ